MDYLFQKHYAIAAPAVLLVESDPEALSVYARHLTDAHFSVTLCLGPDQLLAQVRQSRPHLLVINPSPDVAATVVLLQQLLKVHPDLPVITVGEPIPDFHLDELMATGVVLHMNRIFSQPRDIAVAARQMLGLD